MRRAAPVIILAALGVFWYAGRAFLTPPRPRTPDSHHAARAESDAAVAFKNRRSNVQVTGTGAVSRILKDDLEGGRHQRFILTLDSGQTLLVSHNIDLAPDIPDLGIGNSVSFFGEYEWNKRGGVLHWTHKDSANRHPHGWLKHNGNTYQ